MSHQIQCIVGKENVIQKLADNWIHTSMSLSKGFCLIPLTENLLDNMNELADFGTDLAYDEFQLLSKSVEEVLKEISHVDKIGYIETDYFGGSGSQSAILYAKGEVLEGPKMTRTVWDEERLEYVDKPEEERAINAVLYGLGLTKRNDIDAFEELGLMRFRSNAKILAASQKV